MSGMPCSERPTEVTAFPSCPAVSPSSASNAVMRVIRAEEAEAEAQGLSLTRELERVREGRA